MTTYTRPLVNGTPTTGQVVKAAHVNEPIDQIYDTILAGGITGDQVAAGAIDTAELATAAVTRAKMDGTIPDGSTTATNTAPTDEKGLANKKYVDDQIIAIDTDQYCKAWVQHDGSGVLQGTGFNITSTAKDSTGKYTTTFATDFADTDYAVVIICDTASGTDEGRFVSIRSKAVGSVTYTVSNRSGVQVDSACYLTAFGTQ